MDQTSETPLPPPPDPAARRLTRSSSDRLLGGVAGGIGHYFSIDPILVRIGFVALALLGGAGLIVYAAALLLVPLDEQGAPPTGRDRVVAIGVVAALVVGALVVGGFGILLGGALVPVALLGLAGLAVWWLVSGEQPAGSAGDVARRAALGVVVLVGCAVLSVASFLASGLGGRVVVAAIVIAAGAAVAAAAFAGGARWLVLPALAIALPLAFVTAADIDLEGGFGERHERPASVAELGQGYRLGAGELVVDLRELDLPAGDRRLSVRVGAGHVLVLVPDDVCVASTATVGIGHVAVFDRHGGGLDVDWRDARRAPADRPRLVLDGRVGVGMLEVRHDEAGTLRGWDRGPWGWGWRDGRFGDPEERNAACTVA